jgi:serine/threonine protein kinase
LPRVIGRYALYEKVASGGMAAVHLGRLLGPVGFARIVAIKRLHSQFAEEPEFVAMFLDEARLAARINHPNVVSTLDVVNVEGELFLVMEYVRGESLSRLARATHENGTRTQPAIAASVMAGVLHGLHAAHEARGEHGESLDIVHRDVSPQNILVGVDGVARVLDFGVAKAVGRLQTTRHGQIKGKLSYMAPEQIRARPVDRRTDVYAASVVLWETLTGMRLFGGDNDGEILEKVLAGRVDPPGKHASGIPAALDELTLRGLSPNPADRFATSRDMARALEDTIPTVVASRIGEWVESAAKEVLTERSRIIDRIEADTAVKRVERPRRREPLPVSATGEGGDVETSTQLSTASSVSRPVPRRHGRRWVASLVVGAIALTAAVVVAVGPAQRWRNQPANDVPPPAAAAAGSAQSVVPIVPVVSVVPAASGPGAAAPLTSAPPATRPHAGPSMPPVKPQPQPPSPKKPYAYDHM